MALNKKPVTGMKDILPNEMKIRDYVIGVIKDTYSKFGFTSIETPCFENINNLTNKQGGENEKLIFKVLKRGEKLNITENSTENDLVDSGLRYDLTVPLVRFYSNNTNDLPTPFKALQMGNVWRADRPQKGRFRQFMQCDIDILGEPTNLAEIELILASTSTLSKLGFKDYKVRINDRQILSAMASYSGFDEAKFDLVFIILDKIDKIGIDGVEKELLSSGFDNDAVNKYITLFNNMNKATNSLTYLGDALKETLKEGVYENLSEIIDSLNGLTTGDFDIIFDPTLVRGMSYYTGTIFEIEMSELNCSVAGGGRYDKMVGKFTGNDVPACGFSIGFERIITILLDRGYEIPNENKKMVYLIEKTIKGEQLSDIIKEAQKQRLEGYQVLVSKMNKNKKFQKEQLQKEGYEEFKEFYENPLV